MKKFKIIILICCIFLLSGCSVEYNLTINDTTMAESIDTIFEKTDENVELTDRLAKIRRTAFYNFDTREEEYYDFTKRDTDQNIILNYSYNYTDNNLYKSEAVSRCYYKRIVNVTDDYIVIQTDNQVACLYKDGEKQIDDITVNIRTNLIVEENNADNVENNVYTWNINEDNYTNKPIYIKIKKEEYKESFADQIIPIGIIILSIIVIGIIIYLVGRSKHRRNKKL